MGKYPYSSQQERYNEYMSHQFYYNKQKSSTCQTCVGWVNKSQLDDSQEEPTKER